MNGPTTASWPLQKSCRAGPPYCTRKNSCSIKALFSPRSHGEHGGSRRKDPAYKLQKTEPQMNTEQSAATKKNLTAETQRTRRSRPWERTLPACPGCPTPCTQDACAPRSPRRNILGSLQRTFGLGLAQE